jgi:hypothetical protein
LASGSLDFEPKQLNDVLLPKNAHRWVSLFVGVLQGWPPWQPLDGTQQTKGRQSGEDWRPAHLDEEPDGAKRHDVATLASTTIGATPSFLQTQGKGPPE